MPSPTPPRTPSPTRAARSGRSLSIKGQNKKGTSFRAPTQASAVWEWSYAQPPEEKKVFKYMNAASQAMLETKVGKKSAACPISSKLEWLGIVAKNGMRLQDAPLSIRSDHDVVLAAVSEYGYALEFAAEHLQGDYDIVLVAAAQSRAGALKFASAELRADRSFVLEAVTQFGAWASEANKEFLSDDEIELNRSASLALAKHCTGPFAPFTEEELSIDVSTARQQARDADREATLREAYAVEQAAQKEQLRAEAWEAKREKRLLQFQEMMNRKAPSKFRQEQAATWFQTRARAYLQRKRFMKQLEKERCFTSALMVQCCWRKHLAKMKVRWIAFVIRDGSVLSRAPFWVRSDRTVVYAAVNQNWRALGYAHTALRHGDAELRFKAKKSEWMEAVESMPLALVNAPRAVKGDRDVALKAVSLDWRAFEYVSSELQEDDEIVEAAMPELKEAWLLTVMRDPYALEIAPLHLKVDKDVVLVAMSSNKWHDDFRGSPLQFVPKSFRARIEFTPEIAASKRMSRIGPFL